MPSRLVLVRHAKSDYPIGVADHDRPLNARGERDAPVVGEWLAAHVPVAAGEGVTVLVSSATRAQATWAAAAATLAHAWPTASVVTEPDIYDASPSTLRGCVLDHPTPHTVVIVGHNPGLSLMALELARPGSLRSQIADRFPTGAIAVLESSADWPQALEGLGGFEVTAAGTARG